MRFGVLAMAGLLTLPAAAAAQTDGSFGSQPPAELVPYTRFAITPWVGFRVPYASGDYTVFTEGGDQLNLDEDRGGGAAVGLDAAYQVNGPLSVIGSVSYSAADQDQLTVTRLDGTEEFFKSNGPEIWFLKAGVQYRLPDPIPDNRRFHPAAYVSVSPALVFANFADVEGLDNDDVNGTARNFALNIAFDAATNIGSRGLTLTFGLEDYITFWDEDRVRLRDEVLLGELFEDTVTVDYDAAANNILMLRAGVSWRF